MWRVGLAIVGALVLLCGCGESTLRVHETEQTIASFVAKHTAFRPTDVSCPSGISAKVGVRFQCHVTGPDGPYTAYVRVLSVEGEKVVDHIVTRPTRSANHE
jgi:hypothetical protein